jgi:hypothetical protein
MRGASLFGRHHFLPELSFLIEIPYPMCLAVMELGSSFQLEIPAEGWYGVLSQFLSPTLSFFW